MTTTDDLFCLHVAVRDARRQPGDARARFRALALSIARALRGVPDPLGLVAPARCDGELAEEIGAMVRPHGPRDAAFDRDITGALVAVLGARAASPLLSGFFHTSPDDDADIATALLFDVYRRASGSHHWAREALDPEQEGYTR